MTCGDHVYEGKHRMCHKCGKHRARETMRDKKGSLGHFCHPCARVIKGKPAVKPTVKEVPA